MNNHLEYVQSVYIFLPLKSQPRASQLNAEKSKCFHRIASKHEIPALTGPSSHVLQPVSSDSCWCQKRIWMLYLYCIRPKVVILPLCISP